MRGTSLFSLLLILFCSACVDRIVIDTGTLSTYPVVIDGFISDQPGPYTIQITKAYDIESKQSIKTPINVKKLTITDNLGNSEDLTSIGPGIYQTKATGIKGVVGRAYKIRVELLDSRIYESVPDTLLAAGSVDKVYSQFTTTTGTGGSPEYGFDVFFNSTAGNKQEYYFLWKFVGTFQADTNPELHDEPCGQSRCPKPPPCSGYILEGGVPTQVGTCTCCSCWYNFFNPEVIISDGKFVQDGKFVGVKAINIPLTSWVFSHKVYAAVEQRSLSSRAYDFWRGVKLQKGASTSLFQPVTGKVPGNFVQVSGPEAPIEGIFYSTSIVSNAVFIKREDVPIKGIIPPVELPFTDNCVNLYPYASTQKPSFWVD